MSGRKRIRKLTKSNSNEATCKVTSGRRAFGIASDVFVPMLFQRKELQPTSLKLRNVNIHN